MQGSSETTGRARPGGHSHGRLGGHTLAHPGVVRLRIGAQDRIMVQHLVLTGGDVASIPGVAKPDAALAVDGQIVRGVQGHTVEGVYNGGGAAIGLETYDGPAP